MSCFLTVDKNRWERDDKGNLKKSKHKIPSETMKQIIDWILSNVEILNDDAIAKNTNDVLKTYVETNNIKDLKDFVKKVKSTLDCKYDVKFIIDNVYEKFKEVITTDEISKIIALKKAL